MLRTTTKLLAFVAGLALSGQAFAQASDAETTTASVRLATAIDITEDTALNFGSVVKGTTGTTTVVVNASTGARTSSGGNATLITGATPTRATYTVTGETDATFAIAITDDTIDLTGPGSGSLALTLSRSATSGTLTAGTATFGVGGSLAIDNTDVDDVAGAYSGTFEVTATYN
jgi:hypothetical protein